MGCLLERLKHTDKVFERILRVLNYILLRNVLIMEWLHLILGAILHIILFLIHLIKFFINDWILRLAKQKLVQD